MRCKRVWLNEGCWLAPASKRLQQWSPSTSPLGSATVVDDMADMCCLCASLCGHIQRPGSLDSCGHYARRTLMAPLCVAVQSGPFVWKWVCIHLLLHGSPSSPPSVYSSCTHTHTHAHQTHTRAGWSRNCRMKWNRGHLGDAIYLWWPCWRHLTGLLWLVIADYAFICRILQLFSVIIAELESFSPSRFKFPTMQPSFLGVYTASHNQTYTVAIQKPLKLQS